MRASQAAAQAPPQPLPLPPPPLSLPSPPSAPRRGRHRASTSSSSSSSSSSLSAASSSFSFCPSPSPATSPSRASTASLVPFSWERHPGVPKMNSFRGGSSTGAPLPLPPPLRPPARRRRRRRSNVNAAAAASSSDPGANSSDPFVAAFAECTRDGDDGTDHGADQDADDLPAADNKLWLARTKPPAVSTSGRTERRWWLAGGGGGFVGFLDLYGCKSAMAVADSTFLAQRRPVVAHGRRAARR